MERSEIEKKVLEVYKDQLGVSDKQIGLDKNIVDDLGADDLDEVECIMALEEEFGYAILEEEAQNIKTVKDAVDLIEKKLSDKNSTTMSLLT